MITRLLYEYEKEIYDSVVTHPIQTWIWGEFQKTQGHHVYRLGTFDNEKIVSAYTVAFHKLPRVKYTIGTCLRGPKPDQDMVENLNKIGKQEQAIFIKLEPDVIVKQYDPSTLLENNVGDKFVPEDLISSPKVAFYPYSYVLNLAQTEEQLLAKLHTKTRYNIKLANRHNVEVKEMTNQEGFEIYLQILMYTTRRQGFYLHSQEYHRTLWKLLSGTAIPHILVAFYQDKPLASFMYFHVANRFFYPYGGSLDSNKEVQAPTLAMWEGIKLGKALGCLTFDMWGSLGPKAKEYEQGYGFHIFKQRFGGTLSQFIGTYDLVLNPALYKLYNLIDQLRWKYLRLKAKIRNA